MYKVEVNFKMFTLKLHILIFIINNEQIILKKSTNIVEYFLYLIYIL